MGITPVTFSQFQQGGQQSAQQPPVQRGFSPYPNLVDPITSKRMRLASPFSDNILHLNPWQKFKLNLHETFVTLPKTVWQGLKGDPDFTFTDFLHVAKIPYYLGGAFLAFSFAAGRDKVNFVRQAIGVGLYYAGVMVAGKLIDKVYKMRTGVDLDLRFRKNNGDIEKVFASADFPRFDLLTEHDYEVMARKMGIPDDVTDPAMEVREQIKRIISTSRADKLILANFLAAVGAGYLARSNAWARLIGNQGVLKAIWTDPKAGTIANKLVSSLKATWGLLERGVQEKITGFAGEGNPLLRKSVLGAAAFVTAAILIHSWFNKPGKSRQYESPMLEHLSGPLVNAEQPTYRSLASYKTDGSAFAAFRYARLSGEKFR